MLLREIDLKQRLKYPEIEFITREREIGGGGREEGESKERGERRTWNCHKREDRKLWLQKRSLHMMEIRFTEREGGEVVQNRRDSKEREKKQQ